MVSRLATAALTAIAVEVADEMPAAAKSIVIVSAGLYERFVNVTTPLTAVRPVVPCNDAVPRLRVAVTTVLLSPDRKLPKASSMRITGCCEKATPAVALEEGCV